MVAFMGGKARFQSGFSVVYITRCGFVSRFQNFGKSRLIMLTRPVNASVDLDAVGMMYSDVRELCSASYSVGNVTLMLVLKDDRSPLLASSDPASGRQKKPTR